MDLVNRAHSLLQDYARPQGVKILALVGALYLTTKTLSSLAAFRRTFLTIGYNLPQRYGSGSWAVVTGGAQGIGAAFGLELASRGFNLILIDLNVEKLAETQKAINEKFPAIQIKTIACDFSQSWNEGFYDSLMDQLKGLDISILVNNVGIGTPAIPIYEVPEAAMLRAITINTLPMTILTRRLIPLMMKRSTRSAVINLSSVAGTYPISWLSIYSATKAYIDFFSRAISRDVEDRIDVISVRPCAVSTAGIGHAAPDHNVITAEELAQSVLRKLGHTNNTYGHWKHEVRGWLNRDPRMAASFTRTFIKDIVGITTYPY